MVSSLDWPGLYYPGKRKLVDLYNLGGAVLNFYAKTVCEIAFVGPGCFEFVCCTTQRTAWRQERRKRQQKSVPIELLRMYLPCSTRTKFKNSKRPST